MNKKLILGLVGLGIIASFPVAFFGWWYVSLEKSEVRRRHEDAERRSGREGFGDRPALFAAADAIVKNDPAAIHRGGGERSEFASGRTGRADIALFRGERIVAATGISGRGEDVAIGGRRSELHE